MLDLDNPLGPIRGMTIYGDHANPSTSTTSLSAQGSRATTGCRNSCSLSTGATSPITPISIRTRRNPSAAVSWLSRSTWASRTMSSRRSARAGALLRWRRQGGADPVSQGFGAPDNYQGRRRCRMPRQALPHGLTFFEEVMRGYNPSLFGFNRATFALVLSQEAATLFEAALRSRRQPYWRSTILSFWACARLSMCDFSKLPPGLHRAGPSVRREGSGVGVSLGVDIGAAFQTMRERRSSKLKSSTSPTIRISATGGRRL